MTTLYVVANLHYGYAREDASTADAAGVYSTRKQADIHKSVLGFGARVVELELDFMPPGIVESAKVFGFIKD